jgi:hypothetical protein
VPSKDSSNKYDDTPTVLLLPLYCTFLSKIKAKGVLEKA